MTVKIHENIELNTREIIILKYLVKSNFNKTKVSKQLYISQNELDECIKDISKKLSKY